MFRPHWTIPIPAQALRQDGRFEDEAIPGDLAETQDAENGSRLICAACHNPITQNTFRIAKQGQHKHVFFNPHGLVFEIGCFSSASGCFQVGQRTFEFTWFEGYAWQITLCSACNLHLGWQFRSREGDGFYGLILDALLEQSP